VGELPDWTASNDLKSSSSTPTVSISKVNCWLNSSDFEIPALFLRDLIQYWGDHTARAAPGSEKID
jgi:hypothetical protein